ncbi:MAG: DNA-processing protein DprA [Planctomycetota bacterium]|nr:DNA-processing protein DprA [Planctomycetota bacterium]
MRIFGSAQATLAAPAARLEEVPDLPRKVVAGIRKAGEDGWAEEELARAAEQGARLLLLSDPEYPRLLLNTYDPPPVLYVAGELRPEDALAVAIVGTRRGSAYGRKQAERLAAGLALGGFTVVSGLARGIDTLAHQGALDAGGGRTLAVLGTGLGRVYPPENQALYERIAKEGGAVLSELPLGTPPAAENFPRRNRIIAGLSLGVVVVEGSETSGALITARYAVDMDREVFAVPGPVDSPNARGPHRLIKQGARLVEDVEDILNELRHIAEPLVRLPQPDARLRLPKRSKHAEATPLLDAAEPPPKPAKSGEKPAAADLRAVNLSPREKQVFELLDPHDARGVDRLIQDSGLQAHEVLATLMVLEVRRLCRQLPGKRFVKA